jgi:hypothetical protein
MLEFQVSERTRGETWDRERGECGGLFQGCVVVLGERQKPKKSGDDLKQPLISMEIKTRDE